MTLNKIISKLQKHLSINEEIDRSDLDMYLDIIYKESFYRFRRNDIVTVTTHYSGRTRKYTGIVGNFTYGETDEGFGPTEVIQLKLAIGRNQDKEIVIVTAFIDFGNNVAYATKEESSEFLKIINDNGYIV